MSVGPGDAGGSQVAPYLVTLLDAYDETNSCAAELLCDRHSPSAVAFTVVDADLSSRDLTFGELHEKSVRFAAGLAVLGVKQGDAVATLMGKSAELIVALLAIWRLGAVHVPLFTAFAPAAIALRLQASSARVIIVDENQRQKLEPGEDMPSERIGKVVVAGRAGRGESSFEEVFEMGRPGEATLSAVAVGGSGILVLLFTSGTTGSPKGVPVPLRALAGFHSYLEFGFDVRPDDVFWNIADPGWAYGLYYAILGPLAMGRRSLLLHAPFSPVLTGQVFQQFGVTNFAAAPTVYRSLRSVPDALPPGVKLRCASSAGEPLTPDVVAWSEKALGVVVRDHYGQTEQGMMIANGWHDALRQSVRPGSMGRAMPGFRCEILLPDRDEPAPAGTTGRVAVDVPASPLAHFEGYLEAPERTAERFSGDGRWYITGDVGLRDEEGFFYFSARDDDVIIMAGYRIGPFDVESVLVMHERVAEAAVVGLPDERLGEVLEAFVVLRDDHPGSEALVSELQQLVRKKFAAHAYPRRVHFVSSLPKTPSGKVQRFLLRRQARG